MCFFRSKQSDFNDSFKWNQESHVGWCKRVVRSGIENVVTAVQVRVGRYKWVFFFTAEICLSLPHWQQVCLLRSSQRPIHRLSFQGRTNKCLLQIGVGLSGEEGTNSSEITHVWHSALSFKKIISSAKDIRHGARAGRELFACYANSCSRLSCLRTRTQEFIFSL